MNIRGRYCHVPWGHIGVNAHTLCWGHLAAILINSRFSGRWNRNRADILRLWSTRHAVQSRLELSNTGLNARFLAAQRPAASKNVQARCSRVRSQHASPNSQLAESNPILHVR
jgi:hypothetical protein